MPGRRREVSGKERGEGEEGEEKDMGYVETQLRSGSFHC